MSLHRTRTQVLDELIVGEDRQAFLAAVDMMAILSRQTGRLRHINPAAWEATLGYKPDEINNLPFANLFNVDDLPALAQAIRALDKEDWRHRLRLRALRKAGGEVWVSFRATRWNGIGRSFITLRDVSESVEYEHELERFRALLTGHGAFGISQVDAKGIIKYQSPFAKQLLGYAPGEMIGQNAFDYIWPEDVQAARMLFAGLLGRPNGTTRSSLRWKRRREDGQIEAMLLEIVGINLLDQAGIESVLLIFWDISNLIEVYTGPQARKGNK